MKGVQIPVSGHDWSLGKFGSLFIHFIGRFLISLLARLRGQTIVTDLFGLQYLNLLSTMSLTVPI